jgi:hypothetical protein
MARLRDAVPAWLRKHDAMMRTPVKLGRPHAWVVGSG